MPAGVTVTYKNQDTGQPVEGIPVYASAGGGTFDYQGQTGADGTITIPSTYGTSPILRANPNNDPNYNPLYGSGIGGVGQQTQVVDGSVVQLEVVQ